MFHNNSDHRKLTLKDKLKNIKREKGDSISKHLSKFAQCQDELGSVGIIVSKDDLVNRAFLGLLKWEGESTKVGEFVVQLSARRNKVEHQRWNLIQA